MMNLGHSYIWRSLTDQRRYTRRTAVLLTNARAVWSVSAISTTASHGAVPGFWSVAEWYTIIMQPAIDTQSFCTHMQCWLCNQPFNHSTMYLCWSLSMHCVYSQAIWQLQKAIMVVDWIDGELTADYFLHPHLQKKTAWWVFCSLLHKICISLPFALRNSLSLPALRTNLKFSSSNSILTSNS